MAASSPHPPNGPAAGDPPALEVGLGAAWRALGRAGRIAVVVVILFVALGFARLIAAAAEGEDRLTDTERVTVTRTAQPPVTVTRTVTVAPAR